MHSSLPNFQETRSLSFTECKSQIINHKDIFHDFENIDFQGINWLDMTNKTRSSYRALRNNQYRPYLSETRFSKLVKYPVKWKLSKIHGGYYKFLNFYSHLKPVNGHFQLRYNLKSASYHDLYFFDDSAVIHYCTLRKARRRFELPTTMSHCCLDVASDLFAVGDLEGKLYLYDAKRLKTLFSGPCLDFQDSQIINSVRILPSSPTRLAIAANDCKIRVMDIETMPEPIQTIPRPNPVNHVAFSADQTLIASYSDQTEAEIFDANTGKLAMSLAGHSDFGFCLDWHPNGNYLATGNQDTTARVWDIRNPKQAVHVLQGEIGSIYTVKYSMDGRFLATGEAIDFVNVYDCVHDYRNFQQIDFFGECVGVDFNPEDSEKLFIGVNIKDFDGVFEFQQKKKITHKTGFQLKNSFL